MSPAKIARAVRRKNVFIDLQAVAKEEVLREIVGRLQENGELSRALARTALDALVAREKMGSTGIGNGIAIPHVKLKNGPEETMVAIARSDAGVEFAAIDGEKVNVIFLVISSEDRPEDHLAILKAISAMVRDGYRHRLLLGSRT
ncbi:MAG: PTS sugar transporter subunit IIA, partial [Planctomycetes bacterium]|nr:PTS sugar transporter subunit IIA [Planctomycetota bacterium]